MSKSETSAGATKFADEYLAQHPHSIVTFYIPTLRANRMPDTAVWFALDDDLPWVHAKIRSLYSSLPDEATSSGKNMVFVRWAHILKMGPAIDPDILENAFTMMKKDMGLQPEKNTEISVPEVGMAWHREQSVLSIATPLLPEDGILDKAISDAYDRCIRIVRTFEQAYVVVTRDVDYLPQSLLNSYPVVPYLIRDLDDSSHTLEGLFQVNFRHGLLTKVDSSSITLEEFEGVKIRNHRIQNNDPWTTHTLLYFGAQRSIELLGDRIGCITQAYTAGESLIDALVLSLFWEHQNETINGIVLDEATFIDVFEGRRYVKWRSDNILSKLLRGWYPGDPRKPIFEWFDRFAKIRNRAVHLGQEPTELDCKEAIEKLDEIIVYVGDVLAHEGNRYRFPKTAMLLLGESGLRRRGAYGKRMEQIVATAGDEIWADSLGEFTKRVTLLIWK